MLKKSDNDFFILKIRVLVFSLLWALVMSLSIFWNIRNHNRSVLEFARIEARTALSKDILMRKWASRNEWVYVPVSEHTPPNPYLIRADRDIRLADGKLLTLVNPAYMTRQVHELQKSEKGILGHITSLKPIRPQNAPDEWEQKALTVLYKRVQQEISSLETINGALYVRLMQPLVVDQTCLRCHTTQGYSIGDVNGGISVAVPMDKFYSINKLFRNDLIAHGIIYTFGMVGIGFWSIYSRNRIRERKRSEEQLHIKDLAIEVASNAIVLTDLNGAISYTNRIFYAMWHCEERTVLGRSIETYLEIGDTFDIISHIREFNGWFGELTALRSDGNNFYVLISASLIRDDNNTATGIIFTFSDISMRKVSEIALKASEKQLKMRNDIIERDLKIAQLVQDELMARKIPATRTIKIDYRYNPVEKIGGDYFAFFKHGSNGVSVFIGDVSGHGVASALFHSLINTTIEKVMRKCKDDPAGFMQLLNKKLFGHMSSYYMTGIFGIIQPVDESGWHRFLFANGGHLPPVVIKKNGDISIPQALGHLIGVNFDYEYQNYAIDLFQGDRVFLFTDGIPETMNEKKEMIAATETQLLDLFGKNVQESLGSTLDAVIAALEAYKGNEPFSDDIVLIGFEIL